MTPEARLKHIAHEARVKFKLHVWQWLPGHVGGHSRYSLHHQVFSGTKVGRAFDAYGLFLQQARFARWVRRNHKEHMAEVIYNGRFTKVSIKNGKTVPPSFWGAATWNAHKDHVHIGI